MAKFETIIQDKARDHGVDPNLVKAIIQVESNWDPNILGDDGRAIGLMQVWLSTARSRSRMGEALTKDILFRPKVNINQGVGYLRAQYDRYGSWEKAVSAYNAGRYLVDPETGNAANQGYVDKVNKYYKKYAGRYLYPYKGRSVSLLPLLLVGAAFFLFRPKNR